MIFTYRKLATLLQRKSDQLGRTISLDEVAEGSGVPVETLRKLLNNNCGSVPLATVDRLCIYFDVDSISDILEYVE